jgi:hypothetical protein
MREVGAQKGKRLLCVKEKRSERLPAPDSLVVCDMVPNEVGSFFRNIEIENET